MMDCRASLVCFGGPRARVVCDWIVSHILAACTFRGLAEYRQALLHASCHDTIGSWVGVLDHQNRSVVLLP